MGGNFFAHLATPRMPPAVYHRIKQQITTTLRPHFKHIAVPAEAPAKVDYGDIDVLVAEPLALDGNPSTYTKQLATILNAHECQRQGDSLHLALLWPEDASLKGLNTKTHDTSEPNDLNLQNLSLDSASEKFIQVDLRLLPDYQTLNLLTFHHAHGDLWSIISSSIRRYGLTCTDKGLFIRIRELEDWNRRLSRVLVSQEPNQILSFLGFDVEQFWTPFDSWDEMMRYATSCRFHDPARVHQQKIGQLERGSIDDDNADEAESMRLKANDRRRIEQRPLFAYYINNYLPAHQRDPPGKSVHLSREDVILDAKSFFGEDFVSRFDRMREAAQTQMLRSKFYSDFGSSIVPLTPLVYVTKTDSGDTRGEELSTRVVMKALKRHFAKAEENNTEGGDTTGNKDRVGSGGDGDDGESDVTELDEGQKAWMKEKYDDARIWADQNWRDLAIKRWLDDKEKCRVEKAKKNKTTKDSEGQLQT